MQLIALLVLCLIVVGVLMASVWLGSAVYVIWRMESRDALHKKRHQTGWNYGPYVSPFPWHDEPDDPTKKVA